VGDEVVIAVWLYSGARFSPWNCSAATFFRRPQQKSLSNKKSFEKIKAQGISLHYPGLRHLPFSRFPLFLGLSGPPGFYYFFSTQPVVQHGNTYELPVTREPKSPEAVLEYLHTGTIVMTLSTAESGPPSFHTFASHFPRYNKQRKLVSYCFVFENHPSSILVL
jgi:hypothetical protein